MKRRSFLLGSLSTSLIGCEPSDSPANPAVYSEAQSVDKAVLVRTGEDRNHEPMKVFGGLNIDTKIPSVETSGNLYLIEHTDEAKGGPPKHIHHEQDEWFYVLKGVYRMEVGEEKIEIGPGDSVFAPRRIPHVWAHSGDGEGKLLIAFQPAGLMESFLKALSQLGSTPPQEELRSLFSSHGMTIVGPPMRV